MYIGIDDSIHISLPKGGYKPLIEGNRRDDALGREISTELQSGVLSSEITPIVIIELFDSDSNQFCKEFAQDLFYELYSESLKARIFCPNILLTFCVGWILYWS